MNLTGQQQTADFAGRISPELARIIILKYAPVAPLLASVLRLGGTELAKQGKIEWPTDSLIETRTTINNAPDNYDASTTSLVVTDASVFTSNTLVAAEASGTNEIMFVSAVDYATNTITVIRGIGATTAAVAAVADTASLRSIGYAAGEGTNVPIARNTTPSTLTTYLQHFKRTIEYSGHSARTELLTENERLRQRAKQFAELVRDIELSMMFGVASENIVDSDGKKVRTMGGLVPAATVHGSAIDGAMSKADLNAAAAPVLQVSGGRCQLFAGPILNDSIHTLAENKLQTQQGNTAFGLSITEVSTPDGVVEVVRDNSSLTGARAGDGIFVPVSMLRVRASNRNKPQQGTAGSGEDAAFSGGNGLFTPHIIEELQTPGQDSHKEAWEAELELSGWDPNCISKITGVTGAV